MRGVECVLFGLISAENRKTACSGEIIDQYLAGITEESASALENLYHCASASIYSFALSILKNSHDAEDVLHDCFVLIWSAAGSYRSSGKPMAWILTITKNLCLKKLRERGKSSPLDQLEQDMLSLNNPGMTQEDRMIVSQCLTQLSTEESQIVVLHAVSGFKHREIADLLALPLPTVLSKYNRAIKKLRKIYEGEEH